MPHPHRGTRILQRPRLQRQDQRKDQQVHPTRRGPPDTLGKGVIRRHTRRTRVRHLDQDSQEHYLRPLRCTALSGDIKSRQGHN